jgi:hypothetical protein
MSGAHLFQAPQTAAPESPPFFNLPEDEFDDRLPHLIYCLSGFRLQLLFHPLLFGVVVCRQNCACNRFGGRCALLLFSRGN